MRSKTWRDDYSVFRECAQGQCSILVKLKGKGSKRQRVMIGTRWAFTQWFRYDWIINVFWLTTSATSVIFFLFSLLAGALCTCTTRYQLACLAHTGSQQSPWRKSVLLLTLLWESTQHASHMNNQILSLHSNTLGPRAPSPFHFLVRFSPRLSSIIQQATRWRRMIELVFSLWLDDSQSN